MMFVRNRELLQPITLAGVELSNRVVMSPMTRSRTPGGVPNDLNVEYYRQRASAGLIFGESTAVSANGVGVIDTPGIFTEEQVKGWKRVTDAVHAEGGHMFLQLWHCGHNSHPSLLPGGAAPIGPSALPAKGTVRLASGRVQLGTPREIELNEIPNLVDEYRQAAIRAMAAGFDGVEVHAGNGYLVDQFLRDSTNRRTDQYGGPPHNRMRLLFEIVSAVAEIWGVERMGVRISPTNPSIYDISDSDPETLFSLVVDGLQTQGVAFIDVVEGGTGSSDDQCSFDFLKLRGRFTGVYIANNNYTFDSGNSAVREGRADMIGFGRPYVANPALVERSPNGVNLNEVNRDTIHGSGAVLHVDYPV